MCICDGAGWLWTGGPLGGDAWKACHRCNPDGEGLPSSYEHGDPLYPADPCRVIKNPNGARFTPANPNPERDR